MNTYSHINCYRPDVDGLRALAVVSVVFFHAGLDGFGGGYIGVDVFFVISGYLITSHILSDLNRGVFSLGEFYLRRMRRILPALAAMIMLTLIVGLIFLTPTEYLELGRATRSSGVFLSNHLFWETKNNYWNQDFLSSQPLLHTWSLAVEEQFYLILPFFLAALYRFKFFDPKRTESQFGTAFNWLLVALIVFSLLYSVCLLPVDAAAAFYLLPSRFWELLSGGLLAAWQLQQPQKKVGISIANMIGLSGLLLIIIPIFFYTERTPFPGLGAVPVVLGTIILIFIGSCEKQQQVLSYRFLAFRPLVFIGLISYSLYLWHWPLLVFFRSAGWYAWQLPVIPVWFNLLVIFFISWLSWRFIEQPFRTKTKLFKGLWLSLGAGFSILVLFVIFGACAVKFVENSSRYPKLLPQSIARLVEDLRVVPGINCEGNPALDSIRKGVAGCSLGELSESSRDPSFILIGDSHARMWVAGLDKLAKENHVTGLAYTYSSCTPVKGYTPPSRPECAIIINELLKFIATHPARSVLLAGYWVDSANLSIVRDALNRNVFWSGLEQTALFLQKSGKEVIFIEDIPELAENKLPYAKGLESIKMQGLPSYGPSLTEHLTRQSEALDFFKRMEEEFGFRKITPTYALCGTGQCVVAKNSRTLYRDKHHLTDYGAIQLRYIFQKILITDQFN